MSVVTTQFRPFQSFPSLASASSASTIRLIINADDFGASPRVNSDICDLLANGQITSASILANGPAVDEAVARLAEFPNASFGAHLNITQYRSLSRHPGLAPILDADGNFTGRIRHIKITPALREAIFQEWSQQIQSLLNNNIRISHLDFHHHVHTLPQLFLIVKRLQKKFSVRKVRISANIYHPDQPASPALLYKKVLWNFALRRYFRTVTTSGFCSFKAFLAAAQLQPIPHQTVELMVHPGTEAFKGETRLLRQPWQQSIPFPCKLINFNDL